MNSWDSPPFFDKENSMKKNNLTSEVDIETEFELLLVKCNNQKLLTFDSGGAINVLLFIHPSPRRLIKMVIHRRRIEDLVLLSLTMPQAANNVFQVRPKLKQADISKKFVEIIKTLSEESLEFDKFMNEMSSKQDREAVVQLQNATNGLIIAYAEDGFNAATYFSKHPDVLSIMMDWYLVYQLLSASADTNYPREEFETAMNLIWDIRDLLASYRIRAKK